MSEKPATAARCSVADETGQCSRNAYSRGWCKGHWQRWSRDGEPGPVAFRQLRATDATCSVDGCLKPHSARGWCGAHYMRWKLTGDPQAENPVRQQAASRRYTDQEWSLIAAREIPAEEVAEQLGIHPNSIRRMRREMESIVFRASDWVEPEVAFLVENMNRMTTEKMARFLGRTQQAVQTEINRLRNNRLVAKRTRESLDPWCVADRPLIAKTCPDCGLLLDASWFPKKQRSKQPDRFYWHNCKACRVDRKREAGDTSKDKWKVQASRHLAKLQAVTSERAENHGKEWTSVDVEVLADPGLTTLQKALRLKRTYVATASAVQKNGFGSSREPLPDPHDSLWRLFWEFAGEEVAS